MQEGAKLLFLFDNFLMDTDRRELRRGSELRSIEPQVFDLLEYLIRNRERVVSKEDLLATVWSGRIVSDATIASRVNAARAAIGDNGEEQRVIRTMLRKGFRFVGVVREELKDATATAERSTESPDLPASPSIAVLPFQNMSGYPEQEYFADGIVEEIITALSRMSGLFVIARNSSFTYKGRAVDVRQVGRELGVRYVLEGSVRKAANRVRISGQLVDAATGTHLWADRFDGGFEDIFDLQDQVTASVVGAMAPKLEKAEIARAKRKPTDRLDAYDYYLRGMASVYQWSKESHGEALSLFNKAINADPDFACAYGMAARCYSWRATNGWIVDSAREVVEAARLSRRAVELGQDDAVALCMGGHVIAGVVGDVNAGAGLIDRALALNPNLAAAWLSSGWIRVWLGEAEAAISHFARAMRLSPVDPQTFNMQAGTASAHFIAGRYDEASSWAKRALEQRPIFAPALRMAVAANALAGRSDEAGRAMGLLREVDPALTISNLRDRSPWKRSGDLARLVEGLRSAGLPE